MITMNSVVFGQYINTSSWLHKLDARIKIISLIILMVSAFLFNNVYSLICFLLFFILIIFTTKIPFKKFINGLKPLMFLLIFTFIIQAVYTKGGREIKLDFSLSYLNIFLIIFLTIIVFYLRKFNVLKTTLLFLWFIGIFLIQYFIKTNSFKDYSILFYEDGLIKAFMIFLRLILIVILSSLLTFTTMPMELNNAIESLLKPFKIFKLPVSEISMMISITLRFIPTLLEETNKIMRSQAARGADFNEGSLKQKITQVVSLLVPMFVVSFKRAEDLANAMEVRCYEIGAIRTKYDEMKLKVGDYITLIIVFLILIGAVIF